MGVLLKVQVVAFCTLAESCTLPPPQLRLVGTVLNDTTDGGEAARAGAAPLTDAKIASRLSTTAVRETKSARAANRRWGTSSVIYGRR